MGLERSHCEVANYVSPSYHPGLSPERMEINASDLLDQTVLFQQTKST